MHSNLLTLILIALLFCLLVLTIDHRDSQIKIKTLNFSQFSDPTASLDLFSFYPKPMSFNFGKSSGEKKPLNS